MLLQCNCLNTRGHTLFSPSNIAHVDLNCQITTPNMRYRVFGFGFWVFFLIRLLTISAYSNASDAAPVIGVSYSFVTGRRLFPKFLQNFDQINRYLIIIKKVNLKYRLFTVSNDLD